MLRIAVLASIEHDALLQVKVAVAPRTAFKRQLQKALEQASQKQKKAGKKDAA